MIWYFTVPSLSTGKEPDEVAEFLNAYDEEDRWKVVYGNGLAVLAVFCETCPPTTEDYINLTEQQVIDFSDDRLPDFNGQKFINNRPKVGE